MLWTNDFCKCQRIGEERPKTQIVCKHKEHFSAEIANMQGSIIHTKMVMTSRDKGTQGL